MIAFGSSIGETEPYHRYCEPGIRFVAEPDSEVYAFAAAGPISRTYNLMLDAAGARDDLEALVLVHAHAEIVDPAFCQKVRQILSDPEIGVAGGVGASGVRSIAWWEGSIRSGSVVHRYLEHGGGEIPAFSWTRRDPAPGEVDAVDGFLLVLSPWAVRNVRFDEGLVLGSGFDVDYCLQVREAARKVVAADLAVVYHRSLEVIPKESLEVWVEAHMQWAEKWDGRIPGVERNAANWKERARRAEAEREAARAIAHSNSLRYDARVYELERAWDEMRTTRSWRLTEPLRRVNLRRKEAAERRRRRDDRESAATTR
jgi:Glycosyltransferase like family